MSQQQQMVVVLGADISDFKQAMGQVQGSMRKTADTVKGAMEGAEGNVKDSANGIKGALKGIGVAMASAFALDKIKDFGVGLVEASGELQAMNAQFEQVFGKMDKEAQKTIDNLGKNFGMIPSRIKPSMTQMTSMFMGLGLDTKEAMKTAESAVTLVADAAAFYDKSFEDANSALNSFIKGNYEGGESIGLFASETQLASWASKNLGLNWKQLDEAGKQVARLKYAEAMQKASGATGQASREADGLQNVLGNLKQSWTDFNAVLGQPLLELVIPIMKNMASVMSTATTKIQEFYDSIKTDEGILAGLKAKMVDLFSVENLVSNLSTLIPQFLQKGQEMVQGLIQGIATNAPLIASTIVEFIQMYVENLATFYPMVMEAGVNLLLALVEGIVTNLPILIESILTVLQSIIDSIIELLPLFVEGAIMLIQGLAEGIISALPTIIETAVQLVMTILNAIVDSLPMIIEAGINLLNALIDGVMTALPQLVPVAVELISTVLKGLLDNLPKIIMAGVELLTSLIKGIVDQLPMLIKTAINLIMEIVRVLTENLPQILNAGIEILFALIDGLIDTIPTLVASIPKIVTAIFEAFASVNWGEIGKNIIDGIASGISNFAGNLIEKGKEVAEKALGGIKSFLGIHSPSRVFRDEVGRWIPEGIAVGVERKSAVAVDAIEDVGDSMLSSSMKLKLTDMMAPVPQMSLPDNDRGSYSINNNFTIQATVREEADIHKIAREIAKEQEKANRFGGRVQYGY